MSMNEFTKEESEKQLLSYIPIDFVRDNKLSFHVQDMDIVIDEKNWPCNLIYNSELIESDDIFYEQFTSDTTLFFYIQSCVGRCKSLISRAAHNKDIIWEHGPIRIFEVGGECPSAWMTRTRTQVAIRPFKQKDYL